jgi:hypothetical protein
MVLEILGSKAYFQILVASVRLICVRKSVAVLGGKIRQDWMIFEAL